MAEGTGVRLRDAGRGSAPDANKEKSRVMSELVAERIARGLTEAQRGLVMDSEPGGFGRADCACGAEARTGATVSAAKALQRKGLGTIVDHAPCWPRFLYFNNAVGLAVRALLASDEQVRR